MSYRNMKFVHFRRVDFQKFYYTKDFQLISSYIFVTLRDHTKTSYCRYKPKKGHQNSRTY